MTNKDEIAISVRDLSKSFKLPHEKHGSIKSMFINIFKGNKIRKYEKQNVLKDMSFEIKKGGFFGIVGRNGSGKSTLLKLLAGIYTPNEGSIIVNGKLTPFIELGVGFNPELTGRENVFLNGALLGFSRSEMYEMYDEIVEFAELKKFMDQKLKNYSSGMQVRLAFSIAIRANTDILVLDEVLAVGDTNFQRKCFEYFNKLKREQKTVILVTHDMGAVERFCNKAILINSGKIVETGPPSEITKKYSDLNFDTTSENSSTARNKFPDAIKSSDNITLKTEIIGIRDSKISKINARHSKSITFKISIISQVHLGEVKASFIIKDCLDNPIFATNTVIDKKNITIQANQTKAIVLSIDNIFSNGEYRLSLSLRNIDGTIIYYISDQEAKFIVGGRDHDYAIVSPGYTLKIN